MEQFGWTEKQLYEENSLRRMTYISVYNELQKQVADMKQREAEAKSQVRFR
jgi:hypothetical protein